MNVLSFKFLVLVVIDLSIYFSSVSSVLPNNPESETKGEDHVPTTSTDVNVDNDNDDTSEKVIILENDDENTKGQYKSREQQQSLNALHGFFNNIKPNENIGEYSHQLNAVRDYLTRIRPATTSPTCVEKYTFVKLPIALQLIRRNTEDSPSGNHDEIAECTAELKSLGFTGERDNDYAIIKDVLAFQDKLNRQQSTFDNYQERLNAMQLHGVTDKQQSAEDNVNQNENTDVIDIMEDDEDEWGGLHDESMTEEDEWANFDGSSDENQQRNDSIIMAHYASGYREILDKRQKELDAYQAALNAKQKLKDEQKHYFDSWMLLLEDFLDNSKLNDELQCLLIDGKLEEIHNQETLHDMDEKYALLQNYIGHVNSTNASDDTNLITTFCVKTKNK